MVLYRHHHASMLGTGAIVSLGSAGVTVLFYLAMRRMPTARLGQTIGMALLLAIPAAIFYSAFNWYMFDHLGDGAPTRWNWSAPAPPAHAAPSAMSVSVGMMSDGPDIGLGRPAMGSRHTGASDDSRRL